MTWAQRLKRVFNIDIEICHHCGGAVKVIGCIEDPVVIKKRLDHVKKKAEGNEPDPLPQSRAPPPAARFGGRLNPGIQNEVLRGCHRGGNAACRAVNRRPSGARDGQRFGCQERNGAHTQGDRTLMRRAAGDKRPLVLGKKGVNSSTQFTFVVGVRGVI